VLTGLLVLTLQRPADVVPVTAKSWVSEVWRPEPGSGERWVLQLFQSTRIAVDES